MKIKINSWSKEREYAGAVLIEETTKVDYLRRDINSLTLTYFMSASEVTVESAAFSKRHNSSKHNWEYDIGRINTHYGSEVRVEHPIYYKSLDDNKFLASKQDLKEDQPFKITYSIPTWTFSKNTLDESFFSLINRELKKIYGRVDYISEVDPLRLITQILYSSKNEWIVVRKSPRTYIDAEGNSYVASIYVRDIEKEMNLLKHYEHCLVK